MEGTWLRGAYASPLTRRTWRRSGIIAQRVGDEGGFVGGGAGGGGAADGVHHTAAGSVAAGKATAGFVDFFAFLEEAAAVLPVGGGGHFGALGWLGWLWCAWRG